MQLKRHVIKVGGSLEKSKQLIDCLTCITEKIKEPIVIVPGGGNFADQVRISQHYWHFNDRIAHEMAILAMQQMALLFEGLYPQCKRIASVSDIQSEIINIPVIWSPDINDLNHANINASWDITSDSLSVWLASQLNACQLTLIKTAVISKSISQLIAEGVIDKYFLHFSQSVDFKITISHVNDFVNQYSKK